MKISRKIWIAVPPKFAKEQKEEKYYKDLLKIFLSSKLQLNSLVRNHPSLTGQDIQEIQLPFSIISGMTCDVYCLSLKAPDLYVIHEVSGIKILMRPNRAKVWWYQKAFWCQY